MPQKHEATKIKPQRSQRINKSYSNSQQNIENTPAFGRQGVKDREHRDTEIEQKTKGEKFTAETQSSQSS